MIYLYNFLSKEDFTGASSSGILVFNLILYLLATNLIDKSHKTEMMYKLKLKSGIKIMIPCC